MHKQADISQQIKKYLDGELDARAMHELERRAQGDPFLMDALEGYENVPVDREVGLGELQSRLQQRVAKKEARIIPWRIIGIAASILLLLGIGLFWYTQHPSPTVMMERVVTLKPSVNAPRSVQKEVSVGGDSTAVAVNVNKDKLVASNTKHIKIKTQKVEYAPLPVVTADEAAAEPPAVNELQASSENDMFKSNDTSTPLNEMVVMEYTAKKKSNGLLNEVQLGTASDSISHPSYKATVSTIKIDTNKYKGNVMRIKGTDLASVNDQYGYVAPSISQYQNTPRYFGNYSSKQDYYANAAKVAVRPNLTAAANSVAKGYIARRASVAGGFSPFNPTVVHGEMVKGMVKDSGEPVAYATVKIKGTNISTLTDAKGRFTLYAVPDSALLEVMAEGYMAKEAKMTQRNLQIISIHQIVTTLSDAIAAPAGDNNQPENLQARPSAGWDDFIGYLHHNAISPDGKSGIVKLSFKVNADNSLGDFKVIKGLSPQANNFAIKLVKDGPEWYSAADDKVQTVTISIKFRVRGK